MRWDALFVAVLVLLSEPALAQEKSWRVGLLAAGNPRSAPQWVAFDARLRELGYVEGRKIVTEFRNGEGRVDRFAAHAAELVGLKPDLIVAAGPEPLFAALRRQTRTIPIVMLSVDFDPLAAGYISSLARPGGNLTGLTLRQTELAAKRLELLKEAVPRLNTVAVLWDAFSRDQMESMTAAAAALGLPVHAIELRETPYDFAGLLQAAIRDGVGAALSALSPELFRKRARLALVARELSLPTTLPLREFAEEGGLMSFGVSFPDQWRRAAEYLDKVLKGTRPGDLPVEQPTKFELVVNLRTARALGLTLPESILARADELID